jgi:hypothetical protein
MLITNVCLIHKASVDVGKKCYVDLHFMTMHND